MLATEKFFDLSGSFTYTFLALYSLIQSGHYYPRQLLVTLFVLIWAARLGTFLYLRIQRAKNGKDGRFDEIKHNLPRFFNMWTIQGLWVFLTELPLFCLNSTPSDTAFPLWSDYLGLVCFGVGFACEVIADNQKTEFALQPENEGKFIQTGLWAFSRHPNYFGEILLWIGIFFVCSSAFTDAFQWICIISPMFVAFLLIKVSGVPLLEARADQKWGHDPAYLEYKARTPELIPIPSFAALTGVGDASLSAPLMDEEGPVEEDRPSEQPIVEDGADNA